MTTNKKENLTVSLTLENCLSSLHLNSQSLPSVTTYFMQVYEVWGDLEISTQITGTKCSSCSQDNAANIKNNPKLQHTHFRCLFLTFFLHFSVCCIKQEHLQISLNSNNNTFHINTFMVNKIISHLFFTLFYQTNLNRISHISVQL